MFQTPMLLSSRILIWILVPTSPTGVLSQIRTEDPREEVWRVDDAAGCRQRDVMDCLGEVWCVDAAAGCRQEDVRDCLRCAECGAGFMVYEACQQPADHADGVAPGSCCQPDYNCRVEVRLEAACGEDDQPLVPAWSAVSALLVLVSCTICWYTLPSTDRDHTQDQEKLEDQKQYIARVQRVAFQTNVKMLDNAIEARIRFDLKKERPRLSEEARTSFLDGIMKTVHSSTTFWLSVLWWVQGQVKVDSIHVERLLYKYHAWQAQKSICCLPYISGQSISEMRSQDQHPKPQHQHSLLN